jgi:hypothetical protein
MSKPDQTDPRAHPANHYKDLSAHADTDPGRAARMMAAIVGVGLAATVVIDRTLQDWIASFIVGGVIMLIIVALVATGHPSRPHRTPAARQAP